MKYIYIGGNNKHTPTFIHTHLTQTHKQYVSFKAGRCDVEDKGNNKFLIKPDRRKGQLMLVKVCCPSHSVRASACLDLTNTAPNTVPPHSTWTS